ncbi:MAG: recombination mediator RecR [Desulfobacterales bacterium]
MHYYPTPIVKLIDRISKLPGIGKKTAERLALHILRSSTLDAEQLAGSILEVKEKIRFCSRCFGLSDQEVCHICRDASRIAGILCVVEHPADMVAVEKSGAYRGKFHILQGVLSPIDGVGPENIRIRELMARIADEAVEEIILATSTSVEGEATAAFIAEKLKGLPVKVTRIATGVPMGGDLKYVDEVTLKRAVEGRYAV